MKILVTGASGFVGSKLLEQLPAERTLSLGRNKPACQASAQFYELEIVSNTDYSAALIDVDVIVHLAARVHVMNDAVSNPLEEYREVNTRGTINLACQAAAAGVKRFIFVSSIKVNGESSDLNSPFTSADNHAPEDDYGLSKSEAEQLLFKIGKETGMEVVVIRPTLVYGPGVKANFVSLMNLVSKGIPQPFGCLTQNKRSLVSVDNLVDLIVTCINHPKAANQVFLVSDDQDVSTSEMVREMAIALNKRSWQLPVPVWCYKLAGKLFNKLDVVDRLTGSLQVDITHTKQTLGWAPPQTLQQGFKQTADAFLNSKQNNGKS
ncbi:UDP-glucose 4-epimerase family protein [Vibrio vulnificus]|uniref:UDP-glucose 4-epimerase family protein n=1 Tax=Vibrio vulnificus TaxID=672 RepID=UPI001A2B5280|nr:SDR family oxidoreductase [Vibrio vulnificus]MCG8705366.1 SDR family oxidoreductase [Vibrio vulnificus]HAS8154961.1 SDR family oxidoreductase [Vibrio vulnificus]HAU8285471.1 NAD-dependent epimerase/dehydratase family protein [Vibrio vulnificus]HDY7788685.1 SDR family oxidoreductase [Vibrio vulnificus]HDY8125485.1 SDR family oxidoreductase [Vibrio vulnificus]